MLPQTQARQKRNSSKVNLLISFTFHTVLVVALFYFAARSGYLGHQLQKISVDLIKPKQPEKPKEPEKPKVEPPKVVETPKPVETPKAAEPIKAPSAPEQAAVAPPAAELASFDFAGGQAVISSSDPIELYKGAIQTAFLAKWSRPENLPDDDYVAEVAVSVGPDGRISNTTWEKGSGNSRWDDSVRAAIAAVTKLNRPPPTNFPSRVIIRFDVQKDTQPVLQ